MKTNRSKLFPLYLKPYSLSLITYFLFSIFLISCAKEDNTPPTDDRDKFLGTWTCSENSSQTGNNPPFTVNITEGSGTDEVLIDNFYGLGIPNKAIASITVNDIDIFTQVLDGKTIRGNGSISGTVISMNYTVNDAGIIDTVSATFSK